MWTNVYEAVSQVSAGDWLLLCAALPLLLYIWGTWTYDYFQKRGIYYIKPKFPFFGSMSSAIFALDSFPNMIKNLYDKGEGHSIVGVFEFRAPIIMVRDPELLKMVAVKDFDHFVNRRIPAEIENIEPLFSKNLANLKDNHWRRMRATLSPAFTTSKIKGMFPLICQCADQMTEYLIHKYDGSEDRRKETPMEIEMKDVCSRVANDIIASVVFGVQCDSLKERENQFHQMGKSLTNLSLLQLLKFVMVLITPKIMKKLRIRFLNGKAVDFFDSLVHETIRERQKKGIFRPDVLQLLIQARQGELKAEAEDDGEDDSINSWKSKLGDDEISAQAIIFFFGGFETVSTTLCLVTYALSFHPKEQKRVQQEIDYILETTGDNLTYEDVQGMKYLDAFIHETMRLFPPAAGTDRQCNEDTVLPATDNSAAIHIPKGTVISIPVIGIHHDPDYWTDPMTFNPDRFLGEKHNIKPFTFMPFGVGPRICIAQRFALLEMKLVLVSLLRKFDLFPSPKLKYPLEYKKGFMLSPKGGFLCCLKPREL